MSFNFVIPEMVINNDEWTLSPFRFFRRGFNLGFGGSSPEWKDIILSGNTALTLTNAKANGLNYLKLFGGTEQRNLPKGHTQLEYVYMTSGSFIKIEDLLISSGYRVEYEFQTTTLSSSLRNYLGGRASGVSAGGGFRLSKLASGGTTLNRVVLYGFETGTEFYDPTTQFQPNTRYKYTYDNGVCTLESGGSVVSTQTFTVTDNTSTKWGINSYVSNNDYWQTDTDGVYGYSLKVWNPQGELVMDLVPDLTSSNVVCYYDMVTGNIREASAGTFEAGTIAPTPTTPVNIISNNGAIKYSANMCNVNEQTASIGYYISSSGVVTADANNWLYQDFIPVKPNTTYTLTMSTSVYFVSISEYSTADDSGFVIRKAGISGDNTTLTITTGSTTNFVRFGANLYRGEVTLNAVLAIDWMLNVGDTMAYQPYVEGGIYTDGTVETVEVDTTGDTATAEMLLAVGSYQDVQSVLDGVVTRNVGIKVFDGTEAISASSDNSYFSYTAEDKASGLISSVPLPISTHFQTAPNTGTNSIPDNGIGASSTASNKSIWFKMSATQSVTAFKAYLADQYQAGSPVIVIYPLATATTETVAHQHLSIQAGTNIVEITQASMDNLELEVSYKAGVSVTVTEIENAQLDNSVEVTVNG